MPDRSSVWSLRRRLLWISSAALLAALLFGGLAMYTAANVEGDQMMDAALEHLGASVLAFVEEELEEELSEVTAGVHTLPLNIMTRPSAALLYRFQVWSQHGTLLMRSYEAPNDRPLMPLHTLGFDTVRIGGEEYRAFALPAKNHAYVIQVAENVDERWTQTAKLTVYYVGFLVVPLALVFGATMLWLRRSLRAVDSLAEQLEQRRALDTTPVSVTDPPRELLPILRSVDGLIARVGHALSIERGFTAVAAHEMRTPLAGLRAHAQLATKATSKQVLNDALKSLMVGTDRATHLIDQLLDLARVDTMPKGQESLFEPVDLSDAYQGVMQELGPRGERKGIEFVARFSGGEVLGHRFAVRVMLRNLIANAINYTPAGGKVEVASRRDGDSVLLTVDDSGPGIRPQDRERALERFNRLGRTEADGVGLGLAIVHAVSDLHRAALRLTDSPLGGLRVELRLVPATAATTDAK
jgi:signal transduction histidine kinase